MFDGVYRTTEGLPVFHEVRAPTAEQLQTLLAHIITRLMKFLTRKGFLIEEQGMTYLADAFARLRMAVSERAVPAPDPGPGVSQTAFEAWGSALIASRAHARGARTAGGVVWQWPRRRAQGERVRASPTAKNK